MDAQRLFEDNLDLIERISRAQCRSHGIYGDEADEFVADVRLALIEDGYRRIAAFQGRSLFSTYLHTIIARISIDRMRASRGRWRPSGAARAQGDIAVELERLITHHRHTFDEACQILLSRPDHSCSRRELSDIYRRLPARASVQEVDDPEETLRTVPSPGPSPQATLENKRNEAVRGRLHDIMQEMRDSLSNEDRLLLKMAFEDDLGISEIARGLGRARAGVDRRIAAILRTLKERILRHGLNINDVRDAMRAEG